jgi:RNA polymerase sigma factor (sigma-70 family)
MASSIMKPVPALREGGHTFLVSDTDAIYERLLTFAHRVCRENHGSFDARDVAADAFCRLIPPSTGKTAYNDTYLYKTVDSVHRDKVRKDRRLVPGVDPVDIPEDGDDGGNLETETNPIVAILVDELFELLSSEERDLLERRFLEDQTCETIAAAYGITAWAVRGRLTAVIKRLVKRINRRNH